ncbi:hypothetical protein ACWG8W_06425 [Citricoccus zhacaiensis]
MRHNARSRTCSRAMAHRNCPHARHAHQKRASLAPATANEVANKIVALFPHLEMDLGAVSAAIYCLDEGFFKWNRHRLVIDQIIETRTEIVIPTLMEDRSSEMVHDWPENAQAFFEANVASAVDWGLSLRWARLMELSADVEVADSEQVSTEPEPIESEFDELESTNLATLDSEPAEMEPELTTAERPYISRQDFAAHIRARA